MPTKSKLLNILSIIVILTTILASVNLPTASAQGRDPIQRERNAETGKVNFIGAASGASVSFTQAMGILPGAARPADPAMALARRFAPEFGLQDAQRDLSVMQTNQGEHGRMLVKYQQTYQGIPVMGGELIVNTNANGDLYSMNGEVSSNLAIGTNPVIDSAQARQFALEAMAKWNEKTPEDFVVTEPELWIFDESLLTPSPRPVELVWRMEVTSVDGSLPIRELMLINAQTGNPDFHFNQVDTAWHVSAAAGLIEDPQPTPIVLPTEMLVATEALLLEETSITTDVASVIPTQEDIQTETISTSGLTQTEFVTTSGATWYVAITGNNANSCTAIAQPCATITSVLQKSSFAAGDLIEVASGTYLERLTISKNLTILGGWDSTFSQQTGYSIIDANQVGTVITINPGVVSSIDKLIIQNGNQYTSHGSGVVNNGNLTITRSVIQFNKGFDGGGIVNFSALTLTNSIVRKNSSSRGGGINNSGDANLNNVTIVENHAIDFGGGVHGGGIVHIQNSIISQNTSGVYNNNCSPYLDSLGHNIFGDESCDPPPAWNETNTDLENVDPRLGPYFPFLGYYALLDNSPAINAGNPATCTPNDQRGVNRVDVCDIGAYEHTFPGPVTTIFIYAGDGQRSGPNMTLEDPLEVLLLDSVNSPIPDVEVTFATPESGPHATFADTGSTSTVVRSDERGIATSPALIAGEEPGSYIVTVSAGGISNQFHLANFAWYVSPLGNNGNDCVSAMSACATINAVLQKANFANQDAVLISSGVYTGLGQSVVSINKQVTMLGGWNAAFTMQDGHSTIDGQNARQGVVIIGVPGEFDVNLDRFVIRNGAGIQGGGIKVESATLTIDNSFIRDSHAMVSGGGIQANNSTLNLNNVSISNNSAWSNRPINNHSSTYIGIGGGISSDGNMVMNNVTISNNKASYSGGGADFEHATLNNVTISNNFAYFGGGVRAHNIWLGNSIIADNASTMEPSDCAGVANIYSNGNNIIGAIGDCKLIGGVNDRLNLHPQLGVFLPAEGYHPLLPGSPAINAGNPNSCLPTDQRGVARVATCDIGAYEYSEPGLPTRLSIITGNDQRRPPRFAFESQLQLAVLDDLGNPVPGIEVTFTAPASGASATFAPNNSTVVTLSSDNRGVVTAPALTANQQLGSYSLLASANGVESAEFDLSNSAWYVSPSGNDSNSCSSPGMACQNINAALNKPAFVRGDWVLVQQGTYTGTTSDVVLVQKNASLSGGWNPSFTSQSEYSIIDGQNTRRGITINGDFVAVLLERFHVKNSIGGLQNNSTVTITNSAFYNNEGNGISNGHGGVIYAINITVSGNTASSGGGGIDNGQGYVSLKNSTVTNNTANQGAGLYSGTVGGQFDLLNSIVAGNKSLNPGSNFIDCYGEFISLGHNILAVPPAEQASWCRIALHDHDFINVDPGLGSLSADGYHSLLPGSPAINNGSGPACLAFDQRGVTRPQGPTCDIGAYEYVYNQDAMSALLTTFNAGNTSLLPGTLACDQTDLSCSGSDTQTQDAHQFAAKVYDFYKARFARNSIDGQGMEIISSVHYGSSYANASWNGSMVVYGDTYEFTNADDVVAHELTHGVTQHESGLLYYYQSGAINESLSDVFGEYFDQSANVDSNDTVDNKWLIGEDVTGLGAIRSMKNPPQYGDPDRVTSSLYNKKPFYDANWDNGGVHTNSGVNNKAVYLMVEGGAFNTKTVTGLGWEKTAAIYYEVQTNLLTSSSDYSDLYYGLQQACLNLIGSHAITSADCVEVKDALDAVEMNRLPTTYINPVTPLCPTGMTTGAALTLFSDDMEHGQENWNMTPRNYWYKNAWSLDTGYATSGLQMLHGNDVYASNDSLLTMTRTITIPPGAFLYFNHSYLLDYYGTYYFDGGVLEYNLDGRSDYSDTSWLDASPLFSAGKDYDGRLYPSSVGNVLAGEYAFSGDSHGYISSRYDLTSLAGKNVIFRWRLATDSTVSSQGWYIDDVKIYNCIGTPSIPLLQAPLNNGLTTNYMPLLNWSDSTLALYYYQVQVDDELSFDQPLINANTGAVSKYQPVIPLTASKTYYWRVRAFNGIDGTLGWSPARSFRTPHTPPTLLSPAAAGGSLTLRPTFDWQDVAETGVSGYTIQISTTSTFASVSRTGNSTVSTYIPTSNLPKGLLFWRVQTKGTNGPSAWSDVRSYRGPNPPVAPRLTLPAHRSLTTSYTPLLKWNPVVMPAGAAPFAYYQLQLDDNLDFSSPVVDDTTTLTNRLVTQYVVSPALSPNMTYYWRVRAADQLVVDGVHETSPWSAVRNFRTVIQPPSLSLPANTAIAVSRLPLLDWNDVAGNTGYTLQVWRAGFAPVTVTLPSNVSQYQYVTALLPNTTYFWKVQTKAANGPSVWSDTFTFTTAP